MCALPHLQLFYYTENFPTCQEFFTLFLEIFIKLCYNKAYKPESRKAFTMSNPSLKKKRLIVLVTVILAFVVLALLNTVDFSKTPETTTRAPYTPAPLDDSYFAVDPTVDYAKDPVYLAKDRTPLYTDKSGTTEPLATAADYPYTDFFRSYFDALQKGDHKALNSLYSDVWYRKHTPLTNLTPQLLYDVTVTRIAEYTINTAESEADRPYLGWKLITFEVNYRIYQNDGSFRRDIAGDMAIVQIFDLLTDEGKNAPKLNAVSYYEPITPQEPDDTASSLLPLILPLVWIALAVIALVLTLILKKSWALSLAVSTFASFLVSITAKLPWQLVTLALTFAATFALLFFIKKKKSPKTDETTTPQ